MSQARRNGLFPSRKPSGFGRYSSVASGLASPALSQTHAVSYEAAFLSSPLAPRGRGCGTGAQTGSKHPKLTRKTPGFEPSGFPVSGHLENVSTYSSLEAP